jgi:hypothetical protein
MKTIKHSIILLFAILALNVCKAYEGGEVLWWTIGSDYQSLTGTADDGTVHTAGNLGVTDVRIRYTSTEDNSTGYLTLLQLNDDKTVSVYDGSAHLGAEYGVGLPADYYGSLSSLSGTSYNFVLELGNYANGQWVRTSMESDVVSYQSLLDSKHISAWDGVNPIDGSPWSPKVYHVVPEPTNGLLVLLGSALLMLRRKRKDK